MLSLNAVRRRKNNQRSQSKDTASIDEILADSKNLDIKTHLTKNSEEKLVMKDINTTY